MGYSEEQGYVPVSIQTIISACRLKINELFGTSYTTESFIGTNFYKFIYATAQRMQENEIKTSEIFLKLQQYINIVNERISRPVNTNPGIIEKFTAEGYVASVKPMIDTDAGKIHICVDVDDSADDYPQVKEAIGLLISQITVAGAVTQGTEVETIVLSNGQSFDFKFNLPDEIPIKLRLTVTLSENNQSLVGSPDDVKLLLIANINTRYRLGKNFEPQRYFTVNDAPWASQVLLEYSTDDGLTWDDDVYDADYDELFTYTLADVTLVEV